MARKVKSTVSPGWAKFCGRLLKRMGWESVGGPMTEPKAIVLGVPHTSASDFLVSYLFYAQFGKVAHIMIKKEFFFWPLGPILRACGAVAVDRSNPTNLVRSLIHQMEGAEEFHLAIAPEGTRKAVKRWKTGFHLIARETGAAVYMGYFDWGHKRIGCGEKLQITGDAKADMARLYEYYRTLDLKGKNPEGYMVP
jgi:1-acyl-sn-glycerol-3-phosphate acyltransferase